MGLNILGSSKPKASPRVASRPAPVKKAQPAKKSTVRTRVRVDRLSDSPTPEQISKWLEVNRHLLDYPATTIGDEPGLIHKDWDSADLHIAMLGCVSYANLIGNLAVPMLTQLINSASSRLMADRAYFVSSSREKLLYEKGNLPIYGLETKHALRDYDVLGFSMSFQSADINMIHMLAMSHIPVRAADRGPEWPIVVRGGANSGNVAPYSIFYDICFLGEAEHIIVPVFERIADWKKADKLKTKADKMALLKELSNDFEGVYVPAFYQEQYSKDGYLTGWEVAAGVPKKVKAAKIFNLDDVFQYAHPIMNYAGDMGVGEMLISRGCSSTCSFCNESFLCKPYRELSPDLARKALEISMRETGARSLVLSAFCSSSYSKRNTLIKQLYEEVSEDIKLMSQRVDEFAADPEFAELTTKVGNRTVSFGVEGASDRMRRVVNKNLTEEQILIATRSAMENGYVKIKYFMIANLPGETDADREELVGLAEKVAAIKAELGVKTQIRFNWTNLNITDHTPFQWLKPDIDGRHLHKVLKRITDLGIRVGFGGSKGYEEDFLSQLLFLGDARLGPILEHVALKWGFVLIRNVKKGTRDLITQMLTDLGISVEHYLCEKGKAWVFPWDIYDWGVTKEYLWKRHQTIGTPSPKCTDHCTRCGVCDKDDLVQLVKVGKRRDDPLGEVSQIAPIRQSGKVQLYRLKVEQDALHRYIPRVVKTNAFRRALYMAGLPTTKDVAMASHTLALDNWVFGVDYIDLPFHTHVFPEQAREFIQKINADLKGYKVQSFQRLSGAAPGVMTVAGPCLYEIELDESASRMQHRLATYLAHEPVTDNLDDIDGKDRRGYVKEHPTVIRVKVPGVRGAIDFRLIDTRPLVENAAIVTRPDGVAVMRAVIHSYITIYHLYGAVATRGWRAVKSLLARRIEFFQPVSDDLFTQRCECGEVIHRNLFDKDDGSQRCLACAHWLWYGQ